MDVLKSQKESELNLLDSNQNQQDSTPIVLYHAYHAGVLAKMLVHRLTKNRNKRAVLLVGARSLMGDIYDKLSKLIDLAFFENILYCSEAIACVGSKDEDDCEEKIKTHFDAVFQKSRYNLENFDEIYSSVDTLHSFGIYCSIQKCSYFFIELVKSFFKVAQQRVDGLPDKFAIYKKVMTKHGASNGTGDFVTRVVYPDSEYIKEENPKIVVFDFNSKVHEISKDDRLKLIEFYEIPIDFNTDKPVDIILTCSQWVLRNLPDVERQAGLMYQLMADYYIPEDSNLLIKPHPLSRFKSEDFRKYFEVAVFPEFAPSDFMPLIDGVKINSIYTTTSSSAEHLAPLEKYHFLEHVYVHNCHYLWVERLHYCISLYFYLLNQNDDIQRYPELFNYGISNAFIDKMLEYSFEATTRNWLDCKNVSDGSFAIIDDIFWNPGKYDEYLIKTMKSKYGDYVFIFMNTKRDYFFFKDLKITDADNFICIKLLKKKTKKYVLDSLESDELWIYTKNINTREYIREFFYEKHNKYLGVDIIAQPIDKDKTLDLIMNYKMQNDKNN